MYFLFIIIINGRYFMILKFHLVSLHFSFIHLISFLAIIVQKLNFLFILTVKPYLIIFILKY